MSITAEEAFARANKALKSGGGGGSSDTYARNQITQLQTFKKDKEAIVRYRHSN